MSVKDRILDELEELDLNRDGKLSAQDVRYLINRELGPTISSEVALLACGVCLLVGLISGSVIF